MNQALPQPQRLCVKNKLIKERRVEGALTKAVNIEPNLIGNDFLAELGLEDSGDTGHLVVGNTLVKDNPQASNLCADLGDSTRLYRGRV